MSIIDLAKARAYADAIDDETASEWIRELADEVESLQRAVEQERRISHAVGAELDAVGRSRDQAVAGLEEVYRTVARLITSLPGEK